MSCTPKLKNTCGTIQFATCIYFEGSIPAFSNLINEDCFTVEEVLADLYQTTSTIKSEIDLTLLEGNGITYTIEEGKLTVRNALSNHADSIVELKEAVSNILTGYDGNMDISTWGLDTECLVDVCSEEITTLKQLLQALITKVCTV